MVVLSTTTAVTPPRLSTTECPAGTVYFTALLVRLVTRGAASGCGFSPAGSGAPAPAASRATERRPRVACLAMCPSPLLLGLLSGPLQHRPRLARRLYFPSRE